MAPQPFAWGLVVDGNDGNFEDCVSHNWFGSGVAVRGKRNKFLRCSAVAVHGTEPVRYMRGLNGSGWWSDNFENDYDDCVAVSCHGEARDIVCGVGFNFGLLYADAANGVPLRQLDNCEAYGVMQTGLSLWLLGTSGYDIRTTAESYVRNFCAWHVSDQGFFSYAIQQVTFDGFAVHGDTSRTTLPSGWAAGDYWSGNITIRNADISGVENGIRSGANSPGVFLIDACQIESVGPCVLVQNLRNPGAGPGQATIIQPRKIVVNGGTFEPASGEPIGFEWITEGSNINYVQLDQLEHDGQKLYRPQQAASAICPTSDPVNGIIGCPAAGLTNQQALVQQGVCVCGEVSNG